MSPSRARVAAFVSLALIGGCVKKEACRPGTVLLTLTFDGAATAVTGVEVTTQVGGNAAMSTHVNHPATLKTMTIEISLSAYQAGAAYTVGVAALGTPYAVTGTSQLSAGCSTIPLSLAAPADAGAGDAPHADGAFDVSGAADAPPDLACGGSAHVCGDACAENTDPQTCGSSCVACALPANAALATCDGTTCGFVCKSGYHRCGDACADDTSAQTCGTSCSACVAPAGGTATCDGTTCGGGCPTNEKLCAGTCIATTAVCTAFCAVGTHDCGGLCASNMSLNSCGPSVCTACPTPTNGTARCDGTACGATCADGYKPCPDATCVPIGGCCTAADCGTPPNGIGTCTGGHTCSLTCQASYHPCDGQCVDSTMPAHCGTSCSACAAPTGGAATCDGQTCGGACPDGEQLCAGACISTSQKCMNQCAVGTHDCNGQCLANTSVNSCGSRCDPCPVPANGAPTCNGTACNFTCGGGFRRCGAACIPASGCCVDADCTTVMNGTVSCSANHLCNFSCGTGYHACNGRCALNTSTASCGTSCSACAPPQGGVATCDGTMCGASCPTGQKLCNNVCIDGGAACMGTCPTGTHDCGGLCSSDTSVNSCGTSCAACPAVANTTSTCVGGACGFQCSPGYKLCNGACIASSLCCNDADCSGGACMAGLCCPAGQLNCGGACVDPTTNASHCGGCGKACAGRCSLGLCCGANQNACAGACYNTNSDATHCGPSCKQCALNLLCLNGSCVL